MDFTREPIIESVITPKQGCKIVVRSSKNPTVEEHFVDAVEVVSFGPALFFRSMERPKAFLVPVGDYEVLEVREPRLVLKHTGTEKSIKIAGGKEAAKEPTKESAEEEKKGGRKREGERRRPSRRRQRKEPEKVVPSEEVAAPVHDEESIKLKESAPAVVDAGEVEMNESMLSRLIPPPPTLISETIEKYKDEFKEAFYGDDDDEEDIYGSSPRHHEEPATDLF